MDFEGLKLLFCVAAFGWIVYMAFKQKTSCRLFYMMVSKVIRARSH